MSEVQAPKILVIEDETTQRILVKEYLEESGFVVRLADDGKRGLEMASAINPDLIILDLLLPSMDGYTLCRRLKQDPATEQIPVVLVTAAREADVIERGMAAGASDFVTKPVDWSYLADRVAHVLQQSQDMKRLAAEKYASEQKLLAILESRDLSPEQIEEIRQLSVAPQPAPAPIGVPVEELDRRIRAVHAEADERVRQAEIAAAENAARQLEQASKSFWSLMARTSQAYLPMLTALDNLTKGVTNKRLDGVDGEPTINDTPSNAVQELLAATCKMNALARDMAGEAEWDEQTVELSALAEEAAKRFRPQAEERQIERNAKLTDSHKCTAAEPSLRESLSDKSAARREDVPIARLNALLAS